ncbi:SidA/IucD/PvdA family monooxygenase [Serratia marcescens]|nr:MULTISPECIES: SidA/IucD/PvdA family monooxygenase [Serratia]AGE17333.1 L-lysine 6-monooxygenase [Serratia marcescens WW4]MDY7607654.1 SidA/IucD/PvdA family monooxygenase [Serratia marcescens]BEN43919.1 L-ornithine N(5)-monooxygenase [Serratia marcescens]BEO12797.1 L-ornithine N(5)-monooxygenase [Serratia marcescens]BEO74881.1 L-ornithine N(5)-monooxygenase [Serratia marcescens]
MQHTDLLMIGCGPSNLAVGVALEECAEVHNINSSLILEKDTSVCWHRGMLFPEAQSQVSFLKDLVTQRDPTSRFSFLNFLHKTNRLDSFVNLQTFNPYRKEISDYLQWVAGGLEKTQVIYNSKVVAVRPELASEGQITGWHVTVENGDSYRARRLIFGAGRDLNIPAVFEHVSPDNVIHSANFLTALEQMKCGRVNRIAVIGGAQSSAEMYQSCLEHFPTANITMIMRSIGLVNYEGSQFTNTLFQNDYINTYFNCDNATREKTLAAMHTTNYSGVAPSTLSGLYRFHYLQELRGENRAVMLTQCDILHAVDDDGGVLITWKDNKSGHSHSARFDVVLLGTGYKNKTPTLFDSLSNHLDIEKIRVDRNYRAVLPYAPGVSLHLQGVNESTHGIADSLLSVLAFRSKEIIDDITA